MAANSVAGHMQPWLCVRTFERGVEAETQVRLPFFFQCLLLSKPRKLLVAHSATQACGTGVAACALVAASVSDLALRGISFTSPVKVPATRVLTFLSNFRMHRRQDAII